MLPTPSGKVAVELAGVLPPAITWVLKIAIQLFSLVGKPGAMTVMAPA